MTPLETFLRKERILNKFKKNLCSKPENIESEFKEFAKIHGEDRNAIAISFKWANTKEDVSFWVEVDEKYESFLETYKL